MTTADIELILDSLQFTRMKFESYRDYPAGMREQRLADVNHAVASVRALRNELPLTGMSRSGGPAVPRRLESS